MIPPFRDSPVNHHALMRHRQTRAAASLAKCLRAQLLVRELQ
jgi:hypothetical protein